MMNMDRIGLDNKANEKVYVKRSQSKGIEDELMLLNENHDLPNTTVHTAKINNIKKNKMKLNHQSIQTIKEKSS